MNTRVCTVNTMDEANNLMSHLKNDGYPNARIYVLNLDHKEWHNHNKSIAKLHTKMRSLGISEYDAAFLEAELKQGKKVVIAWGGTLYSGEEYDATITYTSLQILNR